MYVWHCPLTLGTSKHTHTHTHTHNQGGLDDVNCYRTVERYDPESNEWVEISPLRTSRGGVGVATLGGYLYACGGNDGSTSLQTMERYDPHTNKWTEVTPMTKRRAGVGLAALNGYLYAVGGFDDASPLDSVERYVGGGFLITSSFFGGNGLSFGGGVRVLSLWGKEA